MSVVIKKNSSDISSSIDHTSVNLVQVLTKEVGQFQFNIKNFSGKATCVLGDQIDIYENSVHIFGGTVTDIENVIVGGILLATQYSCNDWSFRLNSKLVVKTYTSVDASIIIADILTNFTDGTYTTNNVQSGSIVSSIQFNYEQVTVSIEKLAKQIGWEWYVDPDKDVHFFPPTVTANAPYIIDDTSGNLEWSTLDIDQSLVNMKNSVYVLGGTYQKVFTSGNTVDVYLTDGTKTVFPVAYPYIASTVAVLLAGSPQTIGTDQVTDPATKQVLYNLAGRFVRFTSVPTTGQVVNVSGTAELPILAHVQNNSAVAVFGEIQDVIIDQHLKSIAEAQQRATALIAQYGAPVYSIKFSTLKTGFVVGQTVFISSTIFGTSKLPVIIKRITGKMYSPNQMHYDIECVGTEQVNFIDIMKLLLMQGNANTTIPANTILEVLLLVSENIASSDTLNTPTTTTGPYKWSPGTNDFKWNFGVWS